MSGKILTLLTILSILMGGMLLYANTAYFPNAEGEKLKSQVEILQNDTNKKLDLILEKVDK